MRFKIRRMSVVTQFCHLYFYLSDYEFYISVHSVHGSEREHLTKSADQQFPLLGGNLKNIPSVHQLFFKTE